MILKYRLVSKFWEEVATSIAARHPALKISFNSQLEFMTKDGKSKSLAELLDCMENSRYFPCTSSFSFEGINLLDSDVQAFFDLHGKKIRVLGLEFWNDNEARNFSSQLLRKLLTFQAPNIEKLEIWGVPKSWENFGGVLFFGGTKLPRLDSINLYKGNFGGCIPLEEIILASGNVRVGGSSSKSFCDPFIRKYPNSVHFSSSLCPSTGHFIFNILCVENLNPE